MIPGRADSSLLFQAISYQRKELQMPPTGRLSDAELEDFKHWIEIGAPDPREDQRGSAGQKIDLEKGRRFWCFRPVQDHDLPEVKDEEWVRSPLDHFILARLESGAMAPAHEAEKGDWLRRVTFGLTGLPPAPGEVVDFREECVQRRLVCSVGVSPTGARVRSPVAWIALVEETKLMKPIDKAILGMVSESPGRNASEPRGGLEKM